MKINHALVISPHADDEVFGCGILMLMMQKQKMELSLQLIASSSIIHRDGISVLGSQRESEFLSVAKKLGARSILSGMKDTELDRTKAFLIGTIELALDRLQPDTVLFPYKSFHQDHQAVYEAVFAACRPGRAPTVRNVICYEVPNYVWHTEHDHFVPNWYLPCTAEDLAEKLNLCQMYKSQTGRLFSPITEDVVSKHASYRGYECGIQFAEAFRIVRSVNSGF